MTGEGLDAVFSALADPTRRDLVARLVREGPHTATALARDMPMTRQAVVHHLQALGEAGLVDASREGREVRYRATPEPLGSAVAWMLSAGARWDRRLQRLRTQVEPRAAVSPGGPSPLPEGEATRSTAPSGGSGARTGPTCQHPGVADG